MPVTVVYLKNWGQNKKGDRTRMTVRPFVNLRKKGIVKRVPTTAADLENSRLLQKNQPEEKPEVKTAPKKKPAAKKTK